MVRKVLKPTAVDIFSGAGGITQALKEAGFDVLCGIEFDEDIAESYRMNHGDHVIVKNIKKVNLGEMKGKYGVVPRELTLLAGCPPCQGFSKQRRGGLKDLRNYLIFEYYRMVRILEPKYIFLENVPGLKRCKSIYEKFVDLLQTGGGKPGRPLYYIYDNVVNAADYGVPQNRKRFVLVGIRKDIANYPEDAEGLFAQQTHIDPDKWDEKCEREKWVTIKETIGDLPKIKAGDICEEDGLHKAAGLSDMNILRLKYTPKNGGSRSEWPGTVENENGGKVELRLECHKKSNVGYADVYGRMNFNRVAPTLTGGCCMLSKGRFGHPEQHRAISLREAALLQTFPRGYKLKECAFNKMTLQIGNAVPVRMGRAFFEYILKDARERGL